VTKNRLYQFTARGVFAKSTSARASVLRIFRRQDLDSYRGTLFVTPRRW